MEIAYDLRMQEAHGVAGGRVAKAGEKFFGDGGAADHGAPFEHAHLESGRGEIARADEPVVASPHDYGVVFLCVRHLTDDTGWAAGRRYAHTTPRLPSGNGSPPREVLIPHARVWFIAADAHTGCRYAGRLRGGLDRGHRARPDAEVRADRTSGDPVRLSAATLRENRTDRSARRRRRQRIGTAGRCAQTRPRARRRRDRAARSHRRLLSSGAGLRSGVREHVLSALSLFSVLHVL